MNKVNECEYCKGEGVLHSHDCWGRLETDPCPRCAIVKKLVAQVVRIIDDEPLGYKTEEEHIKLESYASRICNRIIKEIK